MSLLSIVQNVALEVNVTVPQFVMAATDAMGTGFLQMANRAGQMLMRRHPYAALQRETFFTLVSGVEAYSLPPDFSRFVDGTHWDRGTHWEVYGPASPQEWQSLKSGVIPISTRRRFRIKPNPTTKQIFVDPMPATGDAGVAIYYEYVSSGWISQVNTNNRLYKWSNDLDNSLLDEQAIELSVIWRFLSSKGLPYDEEKKEAHSYSDSIYVQEIGCHPLSLTRRHGYGYDGFPYNVPESGYGY